MAFFVLLLTGLGAAFVGEFLFFRFLFRIPTLATAATAPRPFVTA